MLSTFEAQLGINLDLYAVFITWALMFTRTVIVVTMVPFLGGKGIPGNIRIIVAFVLTTFAYMCIYGATEPVLPDDKAILIAYFFKEMFFAVAIGITTIMCFYAIEAGGRIVDSQRGSSNAQIFIPALGQVTIYGLFQYWLGLAVFIAVGGHIVFLGAYLEGFQTVNVLSLPVIQPGMSPFLKLLIRMSADVLIWGMQLAAPVLISIFLTDLVLGIANKMAPQIPVFELGFLMKGYVGSAMFAVSIFVLSRQINLFYEIMNNNVVHITKYFAMS